MGLLRTTLALATIAAAITYAAAACKTPNSGSRLKDDGDAGSPPCDVDRNSWAGRMGLLLRDGSGGALIECVVIGEGLHQIGLHPGDQITALNDGLKVDSARGFESAAKQIAENAERRVKSFEFTVSGAQGTKVVKPSPDYPGCGLFTYDDCGPLAQ